MRLLLIICILLIWTSAQAQDRPVIDGYVWEKATEDERVLVIGGFMWGYNGGFMGGILASDRILKNSNMEATPLKELLDRAKAKDALDKSVDFYINEVDSFLKTYPLCRRQAMSTTLSLLALAAWNQETRLQDAYEIVGKWCSELRE